ncbi:MAG: tetratricopeptide repeat protein [Calditrichaeota bacterium]|nr:tetratricopeptide repeat protein [Calditrichota bacterium]
MKKVYVVLAATVLMGLILLTGCRNPEVEGVVINMQQGLYEKAYDLAKDAVVKYPEDPEAWYLLGELHGRFQKYQEMNEAFNKSLALSDKYKSEIEQLRLKHFAENYNDALKNYYNPAREAEDLAKRKELFEKAAEKFLFAHRAMPSRIEPLTPMSVSFLESGDTAQAEKYILQAVEMNPANDTLMVAVGDFYFKIYKLQNAKNMYEKALAVNPENVDAMLALGEIYTREKNWDKALEFFPQAMQRQPDNPAIPNNIAIILYNNEKYEEAIPYLLKTIELEPSNQNAYEVLSLCYMQSAQKYTDKFAETEDTQYRDQALATYQKALSFLEDATTRFPDSTLLWNNLGVTYAQLGMKDKAEEAFERQKQLEEM